MKGNISSARDKTYEQWLEDLRSLLAKVAKVQHNGNSDNYSTMGVWLECTFFTKQTLTDRCVAAATSAQWKSYNQHQCREFSHDSRFIIITELCEILFITSRNLAWVLTEHWQNVSPVLIRPVNSRLCSLELQRQWLKKMHVQFYNRGIILLLIFCDTCFFYVTSAHPAVNVPSELY